MLGHATQGSPSRKSPVWHALPRGALIAAGLIVALHLLVIRSVFPHPVAREQIRQRVSALTEHVRPRLIIAGDSRAAWQIHPLILAERLGLPAKEVINIAANNCGSTPVVAAFREFSDRLAPAPILLLSVSTWSVNDRSPTYLENDELLWSIGWVDRLRLVSPVQAGLAIFTPERRLWQRLAGLWETSTAEVAEQGFMGPPDNRHVAHSERSIERQSRLLEREWYAPSDLNGVRWRIFETDVQALLRLGAKVVLVDCPDHPAWLERIAGTPFGDTNALFHAKLRGFCQRLRIPLLKYDSEWCPGCEPDEVFYDFVHLNREGAIRFSERVAQDLADMLADGRFPAAPALAQSGDRAPFPLDFE